MSAYILRTIQIKITLHKSVKENYLISKHALKSKNQTKIKRLLQQYAFDNNSSSFPAHRKQAIQYFKVKNVCCIHNSFYN